jgi:hypothetical protein
MSRLAPPGGPTLSPASTYFRTSVHGRVVLAVAIACTVASLATDAAVTVVFGPQIYQRSTGKPVMVTKTFAVPQPAAKYTLHISNHGVTSGQVTLNGSQILRPADFEDAPSTIDRPVTLKSVNELRVQLQGKPGTSFTVEIYTATLDTTPPTITAAASPAANENGWNNSDVTVTFTCSDSGTGIRTCPPPVTVSAEGANQPITGTAVDEAGNTAKATVRVSLDKTPPSSAPTLDPAPNADGWNKAEVTVRFVCSDAVSGVSGCPANHTVTTDGFNQPVERTVTDRAGNSAPVNASVNIDRAPPVLTLASPPDNLSAFTSPIGAAGTVFDSLSGVASVACNNSPATVADANIACSIALTPGGNTLTATATDRAGNSMSVSQSVKYTRIPVVTITEPANLSYLNISPTTIRGTVDDPTATITINSLPAVVTDGVFTLALPIAEGPNIITASAETPVGGISTASVTTTLDTTPPHVTITSPNDTFVTSEESITIAGNINDIVVGTVNDLQAQVKVNGVTAQVANRLFLAADIPLAMGPNVIQAVGRDRVGNSATTQITVTRQAVTADRRIKLIGGNNQSAAIGDPLGDPLIVELSDSAGPVRNTPVIFKVTQNDGEVLAAGGARGATAVAVTGDDGRARVQWWVGHRAGAGGNGVEAYAVGFDGTAIFTATGTQGTAGKIVVDTGNDQIGAIGQPLPKPFIAVVVDQGNNRLGGVPVTFNVMEGGGSFGGKNAVTVNTDSDGRAAVTLTLGEQEGNTNNVVEATFALNTGFPAAFTASGRAPGEPQKTTVSGVVLDNSNAPIPGVTVRAVLTNELHSNAAVVATAVVAQTDAQGQFVIPAAPIGLVKLLVDGSTAQLPGEFPALEYDIVTVAGHNNTVGQPIYLLPLNTANQLCVTATTGGGTLTVPDAPGFSLTFGPGQVTFPGGSKTGCVSVTVVHGDKVPMVPGFGQQPRFIVTIQPAGAHFNPPAPMTLPNVDGLLPRHVTEMYSYDHDIASFVAIGTGTVSDDGLVIRTNAGVGVLKAGWHCGGDPSPTGTAANCPECQKCEGSSCVADNGASCDDGKFCTSADGKTPGADKCDGGSCTGKAIEADIKIKAEVDAVKIAKIADNIKKISEMASKATAWLPCWIGSVTPSLSLSEEKGKFCCEADKQILDGNRLSGGGGGSISASCFIGLSSLAPEIPPSIVQAVGIEGKATVGVTATISDVLNSCSGPQWNEKGELKVSVKASAVFVKVGDIVGAKMEGPSGELKVGFTAENLLDNFHFTGSACLDGQVKIIVEHFGVKVEVWAFKLFDKLCL